MKQRKKMVLMAVLTLLAFVGLGKIGSTSALKPVLRFMLSVASIILLGIVALILYIDSKIRVLICRKGTSISGGSK